MSCELPDVQAGFRRQRNQRSNCQHPLDNRKGKLVPEKQLFLLYWLYAKVFDCVDHNKLWEILKEMGIPHHPTCLLRNLYAGQEGTVRTRHETTDQIANICWIIKKPREFQNIYFCFIDYAKAFVWITTNRRKFWKRWEDQTTLPAFWKICMQVRKQQLELDMEQQTGSK